MAKEKSIVRALAVHQPFAELIVIGRKPEEFRSRQSRLQERVYVYACAKLDQRDIDYCERKHPEIIVHTLPRGVIVGSVEIYGCQEDDDGGYAWLLRNPEKFKKPIVAAKPPFGGAIFTPF